MSVIGCRHHHGMRHFGMNDMDMSYLAALLTRGAQATSS
jgi:hypothetical protein